MTGFQVHHLLSDPQNCILLPSHSRTGNRQHAILDGLWVNGHMGSWAGTLRFSSSPILAVISLASIASLPFDLKQNASLGFPGSSVGKESACSAGDPRLITGSGRSPGEGIGCPLQYSWGSLVAQMVKNLPAMWETWVQSLVWEDPVEEDMASHSSILAWRIPWTEEPGGLQSTGSHRVRHD